jgi:hypothetical protein
MLLLYQYSLCLPQQFLPVLNKNKYYYCNIKVSLPAVCQMGDSLTVRGLTTERVKLHNESKFWDSLSSSQTSFVHIIVIEEQHLVISLIGWTCQM